MRKEHSLRQRQRFLKFYSNRAGACEEKIFFQKMPILDFEVIVQPLVHTLFNAL